MPHGAVPFNLTLVHSHVPLVVAEGRCRSAPPGGSLAWANPQDAASRSADAMPRESTLKRAGRPEGGMEMRSVKPSARASVHSLLMARHVFGAARAGRATAAALSAATRP